MVNDKPNGEAGVSFHFERVDPYAVDPCGKGVRPIQVLTREELRAVYPGIDSFLGADEPLDLSRFELAIGGRE